MEGVEQRKMLGHIESVNMIGGCANSDLWPQIFADVLKKPIRRVRNPLEAGSIGVAMVAYVGLGEIPDFERVADIVQIDRVFEPNNANYETYDRLFVLMKEYYKRNKGLWRKFNSESD